MSDKAGKGASPTLVDVAHLAGVSPMTVSRTLSGSKAVSPQTQVRVLSAVRQLNYRRNLNARSLRPGHGTDLLGVTVTNLANPYYGQVIQGLQSVADEHHKRLLVSDTSEDPRRTQQAIRDFDGRQVEGLVVVPTEDPEGYDYYRSVHCPVVQASRVIPELATDGVVLDDINGSASAVRMLLAQGHRRIAFVGHDASTFTYRRRLRGYVAALHEAGISESPELIGSGSGLGVMSADSIRRILHAPDPPTAFFAANNRVAVVLLGVLRREAPNIPPHALNVAVFDRLEFADLLPWRLVFVDHDPVELGQVAAQLLFDRMDGYDGEPRIIEIPVQVLISDPLASATPPPLATALPGHPGY